MEKLSDHLYIPPMGQVIRERQAAERAEREAAFKQRQSLTRHFAAGRRDRANADWELRPTSTNWELRQSLQVLRARAREAARNNPHFKKYFSLLRSDVVGPKGIQLQCNAKKADGKLDTKTNQYIEDEWQKWGFRETCTLSQKNDWRGVQKMCVTHLRRDGEFLLQTIPADNGYGFTLKNWNVDYLSEFYNTIHPVTGNRIIMSIEVDQYDMPVAYHLTTPPSDAMFQDRRNLAFYQRYAVRVPADQMIHGLILDEDESQVRGFTFLHAGLRNAKTYSGYVDGVVQSARLAGYVPGFLEQAAGEEIEFDGATDPETGFQAGVTIDASPGSFMMLPGGVKVNQFDPKQPTQNHPAFAKTMLMDQATSVDQPYFRITGDMEAVNFSSSRVGLDDSRDFARDLQGDMIAMLCRPVYHRWLRAAFLSGRLNITVRQFVELQNPDWKARGWKYIDPVKDVTADVTRLENKLTTWTDVLAEQGIDFTDHLKKIKAEQEQAAAMGIDLTAVTSVTVKDAGAAPADESGDGTAPPADKSKAAKA